MVTPERLTPCELSHPARPLGSREGRTLAERIHPWVLDKADKKDLSAGKGPDKSSSAAWDKQPLWVGDFGK